MLATLLCSLKFPQPKKSLIAVASLLNQLYISLSMRSLGYIHTYHAYVHTHTHAYIHTAPQEGTLIGTKLLIRMHVSMCVQSSFMYICVVVQAVEDFNRRYDELYNTSNSGGASEEAEEDHVLRSFTDDPEIPLKQIKVRTGESCVRV